MHYVKKACARACDSFAFLVRAGRNQAGVVALALFAMVAIPATPSWAQVRYYYDELGRLIQVVAPDGQSAQYSYDAAGNITSIKKLATTAISVSEFTPNAGPAGTVVTLYGTGFSTTAASNTVKFNGLAASVSAASATSLTVTVPVGATTGPITVANTNGVATSTTSFVVGAVNPAPTISGFTPNIGAPGTLVTLTGTNFRLMPEDNKATVGTVPAVVTKDATSPTSTQLKVAVPAGPAWGKISVVTVNGKATSTADFYALPSTVNPADVEFKGRLTVNGPAINVTTTAVGKKAMLLFDGAIGQGLSLRTASGTFANFVNVLVYSPAGILIENFNVPSAGAVDFANRLSGVGATGTYAIIVGPDATEKGSIAVSLAGATGAGTLTVDGSTPVNLASGKKALYKFTAEANKGYGLALSGLTIAPADGYVTATLLKPDGGRIVRGGVNLNGCSFYATVDYCSDREWQPADFNAPGDYLVEFEASGTSTATFNAVVSRELVSTLTLDSAVATTTITREGQNARLSFSGTANQMLSVVLSGNTLTDGSPATNNTTSIALYKGGTYWGSVLGYVGLDTGKADGVFDVKLPDSGTYLLRVNPQGLDKGSIGVQLKSYATGTLAVNGRTTLNLSPGRNARYSFTAEAGKQYGLTLTGLTYSAVKVTLRQANGTEILSCDYYSCDFPASSFPVAGTYLVDFEPKGTDAFTFNAVLSRDIVGTMAVDAPSPTTITIPLEGQDAAYTFSGTANQKISIVISNNTLDDGNPSTGYPTFVRLYKPSDGNSSIKGVDPYRGAAGGTLDATLPETGTYTIRVDVPAFDKGSIDLQIKSYAIGVLTMDGSTAINLSAGRNGLYSFNAEAGKGYGLALTGLGFTPATGGSMTATLRKLDDSFIAQCYFDAGGACDFAPSNFATSGSYRIEFDPRVNYAATFSAVVSKDVVGTLTIDAATPTTVTTLREGQNARVTFNYAGVAGQLVRVIGTTSTDYGVELSLYKPSDALNRLESATVYPGAGDWGFDVALPETGVYTLFANPSALGKGSIGLRVVKK